MNVPVKFLLVEEIFETMNGRHSPGPNLQFLLAAGAVTVPSAAAVRVT